MGLGEWLGIVLFVVGIPVAWWLGRKNRQRPTLRYGIDERELVRSDDSLSRGGLQLRFRDRPIDRLCRSYVAIWLKSGDAVYGQSIPMTDPLGVELIEGDRVLSVRVVAESRSAIAVSATRSDSQHGVDIGFEFLDVGDGFVVEILHEIHAAPIIRGSIPGSDMAAQPDLDLSPRGRQVARQGWWRRVRARHAPQSLVILAGGVVLLMVFEVMGFLDGLGTDWRSRLSLPQAGQPEFSWGTLAVYSLGLVAAAAASWEFFGRFRRRMPAAVVTNDYEEAFEWSPNPTYADGSARPIAVGDLIEHRDFGTGVISFVTGEGKGLVLHVTFDSVGRKKILAAIAPITLVTAGSGD